MAIEGRDVLECRLQQARIVLKESKSGIAVETEKTAHPPRQMAMIDEKALSGSLPADRTSTALTRRHRLEILQGKAVTMGTILCSICGISLYSVVGGKPFSSILRISCISLPRPLILP
jgi:hypothetical protein